MQNKLIEDFKQLSSNERRLFFTELMESGDIDFLSLSIGYVNMLENKRKQADKKLNSIFTLAEINSKPLSSLKKKKLGQEFIAVLLRSGKWKTAKVEYDWKLALDNIELDEKRMENWGYPIEELHNKNPELLNNTSEKGE